MSRLRLLVLLATSSTLVVTLTVLAAPPSSALATDDPAAVVEGEREAQALLALAAHAATSLSWSGTQYVGTWRGDAQTSAVLDVVHRPGSGSTVTTDGSPSTPAVVTPDLDERLLGLLADHYDLVVAGTAHCAGRAAHVVEARRSGVAGPGQVAGRFWLDVDSGLVLRREVYDERGVRLRSSAFVDLTVQPAPRPAPSLVRGSDRTAPTTPPGTFQPPRTLPGGLELFDTEVMGSGGTPVLHLAYSDGLTTLSVFAQPGTVGAGPGAGFRSEHLEGTRTWVQPVAPERVVWQGGGHVFTLVSDADPTTVRAAVGALPRDPLPHGGLLARLERGLARLGSWLNPLD